MKDIGTWKVCVVWPVNRVLSQSEEVQKNLFLGQSLSTIPPQEFTTGAKHTQHLKDLRGGWRGREKENVKGVRDTK